MPYTRKTCGSPPIDRVFDDVYRILNRLDSGVTAASSPSAGQQNLVQVTNGGGTDINMGYLVHVDTTADYSVVLSPEDAYDITGIVYDSVIVSGGTGYIVPVGSGYADVYFNSNGATRGEYFRMSKSGDTGNTDTGKAESETINRIDTIRNLGFVMQSRVGEGLARCFLI